jgi:hypothetical protein
MRSNARAVDRSGRAGLAPGSCRLARGTHQMPPIAWRRREGIGKSCGLAGGSASRPDRNSTRRLRQQPGECGAGRRVVVSTRADAGSLPGDGLGPAPPVDHQHQSSNTRRARASPDRRRGKPATACRRRRLVPRFGEHHPVRRDARGASARPLSNRRSHRRSRSHGAPSQRGRPARHAIDRAAATRHRGGGVGRTTGAAPATVPLDGREPVGRRCLRASAGLVRPRPRRDGDDRDRAPRRDVAASPIIELPCGSPSR